MFGEFKNKFMHLRQEKPIQFLEIKTELGAGTYGSSLGADALHFASIQKKAQLFENNPIRIIEGPPQWDFDTDDFPHCWNIPLVTQVYQEVVNSVEEIFKSNFFPFVISGDHSSAAATIKGIRKAFPDKRLGVVWVDAHADIHSPYSTPSGNLHGMPLATVLNTAQIIHERNKISTEEKQYWENLCNIGGGILFEDLVYVAIRALEDEEWEIIHKKNIKYHSVEELRKIGASNLANQILNYLSSCDLLYVSFDVDSMDPSISVGTGTPEPDGLMANEALELLNCFWKDNRLTALEIVEINPLLDTGNKMACTVVDIMEALIKK